MKKVTSYLFVALLLTMSFYSCKTLKNRKLHNKGVSMAQVYDSLMLKQPNFKTIVAKLSVKYKSKTKSISLKGNLKIIKDSVVWISLSPGLGIEAVRCMCTRDSIFLLNRLHKELIKGQYSFLKKKVKIDADYNTLESILTNRFFIYPNTKNLKSTVNQEFKISEDTSYYFLKRLNSQVVETTVAVNKLSYLISNYVLNDIKQHRNLNINYKKGNFEGFNFPLEIKIASSQGTESVAIYLNYKKVSKNKPVRYSFRVPSSYDVTVK